jgi:hypothetical protein
MPSANATLSPEEQVLAEVGSYLDKPNNRNSRRS